MGGSRLNYDQLTHSDQDKFSTVVIKLITQNTIHLTKLCYYPIYIYPTMYIQLYSMAYT